MDKGFLLTSDWVDINKKHYLRFMGVGTMGPFEIVISDFSPYFFVDSNTPNSITSNSLHRKKTELLSYNNDPVDKVLFANYNSLRKAQIKIEESNWNSFEADVKPTDRYLMDQEINASFSIQSYQDKRKIGNLTRYLNPTITKCQYIPSFCVLSLDIETSRKGEVISIGLHWWCTESNSEKSQVLIIGELNGKPHNDFEVITFENEKTLLEKFSSSLNTIDPDIIIGWNVIDFDLSFLLNRFNKLKLPAKWGRSASLARISKGGSLGQKIHINGRLVIDGPTTLRLSFYHFDSFKLEEVAQALLGKGKDITDGGWDEIERRFKEDKYALAYYNIKDCHLVSEIFKKTGLINLQATRSFISGLLIGRVGLSTAAFDHFFIPKSHQYGLVAFNVKDTHRSEHAAGGHVLEPKVGLYEHVIVLDFKSLYPSIINTFKIDPISLFWNKENPVATPNGVIFSQTKHALPNYIKELLNKRTYAKRKKDPNLSQAIKILMNSFYGVMGSGGSRFYNPNLPTSITGTGRWILIKSKEYLEAAGYEVLYGDTDSVFVRLNTTKDKNVNIQGETLAEELNLYFKKTLKQMFNVDSHLEIEFEKYYRSFFLPPSRSKTGGSKKRYAGLLVQENKESIQFTGLEFVRSDWTKLAKDFQYELMYRVFNKLKIRSWIRSFINELQQGYKDGDLIYKKRLTKKAEEYTKSTPPHVKAVLMLPTAQREALKKRSSIEYVMTRRGPIPITLDHEDYDYNHYIDKQIKPIADTVLTIFNETFDEIIHGVQKSLF